MICAEMIKMKYEKLFSTMKLNGLTLRNRIVAAPIGEEYASKAVGGAGLVVCGHTIVEQGRSSFASGEEQTAFYKYEVERTQAKIRQCHTAGARASIEIFHAGAYARVTKGNYAVGPCSYIRDDGVEVKALDSEGMNRIAGLYAESAKNAKDLGFDSIFLHFAHGWLPAEFISPLFNHRQDEYGGSIENRAKFPLQILKEIREAVGPAFPVEMRISGEECVPGSIEFKDTLAFILLAEPYIDGVQISAGLDINHEGNVRMATTNFCEHMPNVKWAREVKKNVKKIKVSVVGAVMNPDEAEQLLENGDVDYVAFGRSFLADPDWPNKAMSGHEDDIVPCIRCLQCYHISTNRRNVGCSVNPRYHNEAFMPAKIEKAITSKKVVVIGAGPAGITAALTAKQRGHEVVLLEKNSYVGGTLHLIAQEHYKEDIRLYLQYLKKQVEKSGVNIRLNCAATPEMIRDMKPDAVIIACGGEPFLPRIDGISSENVIGYQEAISKSKPIGQNVVIIGGGTIGAELALELAELERKHVTIIEMTSEIAVQGNMLYKIALRQKFDKLNNLDIYRNASCKSVSEGKVRFVNMDGSEQLLEADTVIISTGVHTNRKLVDSFYGITPETFEIGDALKPRKIQEAVLEGYGIAVNL